MGASMTGGDLVADVLVRQGVRFLFTLCGGHISPILVSAKARGIRVVDTRHEATAVFAADAVARLTGVPGFAAVTAGPGVTNTITALKNAQMAQSPLVLVGGATATLLRGRGALQDIDQMALVRPHVKRASRVTRVRDLAPALEEAFRLSREGVPGPVFLECPVDLLYPESLVREWYGAKAGKDARTLGERALRWYVGRHLGRLFGGDRSAPAGAPSPVPAPEPDEAHVRRAAALLSRAERPVLLVGSQALLSATEARRPRGGRPRARRAGLPLGHGARPPGRERPPAAAPPAEGGAARGRPRDPGRRAVRLPPRLRQPHRPAGHARLREPQPRRDREEPSPRARGPRRAGALPPRPRAPSLRPPAGVDGLARDPALPRRGARRRDRLAGGGRRPGRPQPPAGLPRPRRRARRRQRDRGRRRRLRLDRVLRAAPAPAAFLARPRPLRHARCRRRLRPRSEAGAPLGGRVDRLRRRLARLQPGRGRHFRPPRARRRRARRQRRRLDPDRARAGGGAEGRRGHRARGDRLRARGGGARRARPAARRPRPDRRRLAARPGTSRARGRPVYVNARIGRTDFRKGSISM